MHHADVHVSVSSVLWYKNTISCLSRHISTWQWPFLRTYCPGIYTVLQLCAGTWGEMSTVCVLPELDLPQQQRHVNINLMLHKLLPSWKVFMETLLQCSAGLQNISSCAELQSCSQATTKYSWTK